MLNAKTRSELPLIESALLWSMRAWVIGHQGNIQTAGRISALFVSLNAGEAVLWLDAFMGDLQSGARRLLNIDCVCQLQVNADELLILDAMALLQEAHANESKALLARLVRDGAAEFACAHAQGLTRCLNAAGHFLPRGTESVRRHAFCHLLRLSQDPIPDSLLH